MTGDLVTPCCGVPFLPNYGWEGRPYLEVRVVDGYECMNCYNEWDEKGEFVE